MYHLLYCRCWAPHRQVTQSPVISQITGFLPRRQISDVFWAVSVGKRPHYSRPIFRVSPLIREVPGGSIFSNLSKGGKSAEKAYLALHGHGTPEMLPTTWNIILMLSNEVAKLNENTREASLHTKEAIFNERWITIPLLCEWVAITG